MKQVQVSYRPTEDGVLASVYAVPGCHCEAPTKEAVNLLIILALHDEYDELDELVLVEVPDPHH